MVNLSTIKPGDKIVFHVRDGSVFHAVMGREQLRIMDGDIYAVADPALSDDRRTIRVVCDKFTDGYFESYPGHCNLVED